VSRCGGLDSGGRRLGQWARGSSPDVPPGRKLSRAILPVGPGPAPSPAAAAAEGDRRDLAWCITAGGTRTGLCTQVGLPSRTGEPSSTAARNPASHRELNCAAGRGALPVRTRCELRSPRHCPGCTPWLRNRLDSSAAKPRATLVALDENLSSLGAHGMRCGEQPRQQPFLPTRRRGTPVGSVSRREATPGAAQQHVGHSPTRHLQNTGPRTTTEAT
jgi:hypothetical protein